MRIHLSESREQTKLSTSVPGFILETDAAIEPAEVIAHFFDDPDLGRPLLPDVEVQSVVTVVDATTLNAQLAAPTLLVDLKMHVDELDDYTDADVIVDQIEFADVIVVTKTKSIEPDGKERVFSTLEWLNTRAIVLESPWPVTPEFSERLEVAINQSSFDLEAATTGAGWMQILAGTHPKIDRGVGITGFSFRARRPFHPARFKTFLEKIGNESVLRAKGLIWVATRHGEAGIWMQAGNGSLIASTGAWWAATPMRDWPDDPLEREEIMADWIAPHGDRRQEFSIIGFHLNEMELRRELKNCLLSDEEFSAGPEAWALIEDPLPDWNLIEEDLEDDSYLN
ncbi:MAG: GTP-binding protein [Bdellovibrionales bacterium]|nr:GTP-binding protein [Bdellovibrionales bacterium]